MAKGPSSFHEWLEALGASKAPLSVRVDVPYTPPPDELTLARRTIGHVMADADVRGRLASFKVEPLVKAGAIVLEEARQGKAPKAQREIVGSVVEFFDVLDRAFGPTPTVLNNRGFAKSLVGDLAGADSDLAAARRLAGSFIAPRVNEIAVLRAKADFARLERVGEEISRSDPSNTEALRALLDAKVALRRPPSEVREVGEQLYGAKGARPNDLLLLGSLAASDSRSEDAERYLRELVAAAPHDIEGHVRLAAALLEVGNFVEAVAVYERLTELDGPKHEYLLAIALIYDQMDRVQDAASAFEFALDNASARDQEIIEQAFKEFQQRRAAESRAPPREKAPPAKGPAGPFAHEEADLGGAEGAKEAAKAPGELALDLTHDEFEPKAIGDAEVFGVGEKEIPIEGEAPAAPAAPAPTSPAAPAASAESAESLIPSEEVPVEGVTTAPAPPEAYAPPTPPESPAPAPAEGEPERPVSDAPGAAEAPEEERLAAALEGSTGGLESPDEILGAVEEPATRSPAPAEALPKPPPRAPPALPGAMAPEEAPRESEAIVPAPSEDLERLPAPAEAPPPEFTPVVSAPPPDVTPARAEGAARTLAPVVSAPPPLEKSDEDLQAELDALAASSARPEVEEPVESEPFKRPAFDVDEFMAALEAKTKPVFDHLYDGMMEARRKEGPEAPAPAPTSAYESAPPTERPSVQVAPSAAPEAVPSPGPQAAEPPEAPPPPPPVPALFHEAARQAIEEAARARPQADPQLLAEAEAKFKAGDEEAARASLEAYLRGVPDDARAWHLKGELCERAGDDAAAIRSYWSAVKYDPSKKEAWNSLGVLLHIAGRFDEAASAFESAVAGAPDDRHLWHNLGSTYHELGRLKDAIDAFDRAIAVDPSDKVSYNNKGTTLFEMGDFEGARACFERACAIDPKFEQALNNRGRALEKLEDREGALKSFQAALELNTSSRTALKNLARVLRQLGRGNEASAAESKLKALT
ncbi:MAG TPA: tetratricopeptide repeat protein [Candidatus Thermoplasmatota archaeon]|nr:tetratricopeptide repeat protein [Candidatus Thermoplasmatota archaeon]